MATHSIAQEMGLGTDTIDTVLSRITTYPPNGLDKPDYRSSKRALESRAAFAVASMRQHMTDEGWQIMYGLGLNGYELCGHNLTVNEVDTVKILQRVNPGIVVVQDKREWDTRPGEFRDHRARFKAIETLQDRPDIFKLTILKDAHQRPNYHAQSAAEIGCHAWIIYYHPRIVKAVAPYVRSRHLVRTYHTIDADLIPSFTSEDRKGCLLSGAVSGAYPLRMLLVKKAKQLPIDVLDHPGYHRNGSATPGFLNLLSRYKVSICTSSIYGYSLRKIIESTACGCRVITNLPADDRLPFIDDNLIRIPSSITIGQMKSLIQHCIETYNPDLQAMYASAAKTHYDYRVETMRLATSIENLRRSYNE